MAAAPAGLPPALTGIDHERAEAVVERALERGGDGAWLDPAETRELLLAYGLPLVPERLAASAAEAVGPRPTSSATPSS